MKEGEKRKERMGDKEREEWRQEKGAEGGRRGYNERKGEMKEGRRGNGGREEG